MSPAIPRGYWDREVPLEPGLSGGLSPTQIDELMRQARLESDAHQAVLADRRRARARARYRPGSRTASEVSRRIADLPFAVMTGQTDLGYLYRELPTLVRMTEAIACQALLDQVYSMKEIAESIGLTAKSLRDRHPGLKSLRPSGGQYAGDR